MWGIVPQLFPELDYGYELVCLVKVVFVVVEAFSLSKCFLHGLFRLLFNIGLWL
jgi:hypothetical protein